MSIGDASTVFHFTIDDLLAKIAQDTRRMAQSVPPAAPPSTDSVTQAVPPDAIEPEIVQRLQRISDLANQLREEINQINQVEPSVLDRLKGQQPPPSGPDPVIQ